MNKGIYTGKYLGRTLCGYTTGHTYCFKLDKDEYGYILEAIEDLTDEEDSTALLRLASEISINRNFNILEKDIERD